MAAAAAPNGGAVASGGRAVIGMVVGAILLIMLADRAPKLVNGALVLILVGLVLTNSSRYTAVLNSITGQSSPAKSS